MEDKTSSFWPSQTANLAHSFCFRHCQVYLPSSVQPVELCQGIRHKASGIKLVFIDCRPHYILSVGALFRDVQHPRNFRPTTYEIAQLTEKGGLEVAFPYRDVHLNTASPRMMQMAALDRDITGEASSHA